MESNIRHIHKLHPINFEDTIENGERNDINSSSILNRILLNKNQVANNRDTKIISSERCKEEAKQDTPSIFNDSSVKHHLRDGPPAYKVTSILNKRKKLLSNSQLNSYIPTSRSRRYCRLRKKLKKHSKRDTICEQEVNVLFTSQQEKVANCNLDDIRRFGMIFDTTSSSSGLICNNHKLCNGNINNLLFEGPSTKNFNVVRYPCIPCAKGSVVRYYHKSRDLNKQMHLYSKQAINAQTHCFSNKCVNVKPFLHCKGAGDASSITQTILEPVENVQIENCDLSCKNCIIQKKLKKNSCDYKQTLRHWIKTVIQCILLGVVWLVWCPCVVLLYFFKTINSIIKFVEKLFNGIVTQRSHRKNASLSSRMSNNEVKKFTVHSTKYDEGRSLSTLKPNCEVQRKSKHRHNFPGFQTSKREYILKYSDENGWLLTTISSDIKYPTSEKRRHLLNQKYWNTNKNKNLSETPRLVIVKKSIKKTKSPQLCCHNKRPKCKGCRNSSKKSLFRSFSNSFMNSKTTYKRNGIKNIFKTFIKFKPISSINFFKFKCKDPFVKERRNESRSASKKRPVAAHPRRVKEGAKKRQNLKAKERVYSKTQKQTFRTNPRRVSSTKRDKKKTFYYKKHKENICNEIFINTLRNKPFIFIYDHWPSLYPHCLTIHKCCQGLCHCLCYIVAFCVWLPIFIFYYVCFALLCQCVDCFVNTHHQQ